MRDERTYYLFGLFLLYFIFIPAGYAVLRWGVGPDLLSLPWLQWYYFVLRGGVFLPIDTYYLSATVVCILVTAIVPLILMSFTPWRADAHGICKSAWARVIDIWWMRFRYGIRISRRLRPGKVLGRLHGRWITYTKPFYTLVFGPAGEGKTAGVLIPTALNLPNSSLIINDPAGEIFAATAGARSRIGQVIRLEWNSPNDGKGDAFNPLDPANMPAGEEAACEYIDTLAQILIPPEAKADATSKFFLNSSRSALSAVMAYCYFGTRSVNKSTSVGHVLSWLSLLGADSTDPEDEDPVGTALLNAVANAQRLAMPNRTIEALTAFANSNPKTRNDTLVTIRDDQLLLWRSDYVRANTSHSTFSLDQTDATTGKPVTIYLVVPVADQERFGKASGLLLEAFYTHVTRSDPTAPRRPITLILDELKFMPPLRLVKDGPSILRKFKVDGLLGFQDRKQVIDVYDDATLSGFDQNALAKVVFTLGCLETAEWLSKTIGNRWHKKRTGKSTTQRMGEFGTATTNTGIEPVPLATSTDLMSLSNGRQVVIFRSKPHRPAYAQTPLFFQTAPFKRMARKKVKMKQ